MSWQEHARRTLFTLLGDCRPHMLGTPSVGAGETMARWNCEWCGGSVWCACLPAIRGGAFPDLLTAFVEELVSR
jgi:hypothetical protein